jgi:hypothetical protein
MTTTLHSEVNTSPLNTLVAMFTEPSRAFAAVERRSMAWLPLLLSIVGSIALLAWYFQSVDFAWLQDRMTAAIADPAVREKAKDVMTLKMLQFGGIAGAVFGVPIMYCLIALYFLVVANIKNLELGFTKWFALAAWSQVPGLLLLVLGAMQILMSHNGQLEMSALNPASLNQLFFHIEMGHRWASLLDSISPTGIWSAVLMVIGFQSWSKLPRSTAISVVVLPYLVIYAIWIAVNLMSKAA